MLSKSDNKLIFELINYPYNESVLSPLKDSKLEQIIFYERKYKMNSFDVIYSTIDNPEKEKWKNLVLEFLRLNGDVRLINSIIPIMYFGFTIQSKEKTKIMVNSVFNYFDKNSAICVSNKNPLYKKIISLMNSKSKIVILFTNNIEDFDLDFTNLVICYTNTPNLRVAEFCSKLFINEDDLFKPLGKLEKIKNKLLYC